MYDMLALCTVPNWKKAPKQFQCGDIMCSRLNSHMVKFAKYYHSLYPLLNNRIGCIYQIFPQNTPLTEFNCCDYMLEIQYKEPHRSKELLPTWVNIPENACAIAQASILLEYEKQFEKTLRRLVECSRIGRIAFLLLGQGRWLEMQEITVGTFTLENFLTKVKYGNICSGIMYFIAGSIKNPLENHGNEWVFMEDVLLPPGGNLDQNHEDVNL